MSAADRIVTEDRRLAILVALLLRPGYRLPIGTLQGVLSSAGYTVGLDRLRIDCAWLASNADAVTTEADVATLTAAGADIAAGNSQVPGIGRPGPGA